MNQSRAVPRPCFGLGCDVVTAGDRAVLHGVVRGQFLGESVQT